MASIDEFTYLSGCALDLSGDYRFILSQKYSRFGEHQSTLKEIKNKGELWVVTGLPKFAEAVVDPTTVKVTKCHFRLKSGKYLDNYAKFDIVNGKNDGFGILLVIDPFVKVYYIMYQAYFVVGFFRTHEEAKKFAATVTSKNT